MQSLTRFKHIIVCCHDASAYANSNRVIFNFLTAFGCAVLLITSSCFHIITFVLASPPPPRQSRRPKHTNIQTNKQTNDEELTANMPALPADAGFASADEIPDIIDIQSRRLTAANRAIM